MFLRQDIGTLSTRLQKVQEREMIPEQEKVKEHKEFHMSDMVYDQELFQEHEADQAHTIIQECDTVPQPRSIQQPLERSGQERLQRQAEGQAQASNQKLSGTDEHQSPKEEQMQQLRTSTWRVEPTKDLIQLEEELSTVVQDMRETNMGDLMLHSLYFSQIKERHDRIPEAHAETFNWVFLGESDPATPWANYVQWLKECDNTNGLYWVTGKAGSGKSTLMRYLYDDTRTRECLAHWAAPYSPTIVSCFFWNPGTPIQKSLTGLLRSLLHGILCQRPDLMRIASSWRWQSYDLGETNLSPWTNRELLDAFRTTLESSKDTARFCVFVDGLDEFDGDDKARSEVNDLFISLSELSHIKVCLSSRPWLVYEDAFKGRPSLQLHELTYNDIQNYVRVELSENPKFKQLELRDRAGCSRLRSTIVDKAVGVFIWVYLVVRSLLEGLRNEDDVDDLQRRLDLMPADLGEYFSYMMGTLDSFYLEQAARLFWITLNGGQLTLMTHSLCQENDKDFAVKAKIEPFSKEEIYRRHLSMKRRLNSRCKDLLQVYRGGPLGQPFNFYVDFLHRTVKDFLQLSTMQIKLKHLLPQTSITNSEPFDTNVVLCKSYLAQIKGMRRYEVFPYLWNEFAHNAWCYEREIRKPLETLLDELDASVKHIWPKSGTWIHKEDSEKTYPELRLKMDDTGYPFLRGSFVALAIAAELHLYTRAKLIGDSSIVRHKQGRPLLDCALRPKWCEKSSSNKNVSQELCRPDIETVRLLLAQGADPNEQYYGSTVWGRFICFLHDNRSTLRDLLDLEMWAELAGLLIEKGASPQAVWQRRRTTSEDSIFLDPLDVLSSTFNDEDFRNFKTRLQMNADRSQHQQANHEVDHSSHQNGTHLSHAEEGATMQDQDHDVHRNLVYRGQTDTQTDRKRARSLEAPPECTKRIRSQ